MEKEKKHLKLLIVYSLILVGIASYAYWLPDTNIEAITNIDVQTAGLESLSIELGDPIILELTEENMTEGAGNIVGTTTGSTTLLAGTEETASICYTVSLNVTSNNFTYSGASIPEILLEVKKDGSLIVENLDITTALGEVKVPTIKGGSEFSHCMSVPKSQSASNSFEVKVTYLNLNINQNVNQGKELMAKLNISRVMN